MTPFVIVVEFRIHMGRMATFRKLMDENARASCRDEPGCRRFDVLTSDKDPDHILLYEIYDDRAAFEAHIKTPHFAIFNRESAPLVADKVVKEYALACEGTAA
ncbi:MAG TPA: putative quinol monooxygenase [Alphaproteobacteria bacterium]|nr:putative quinol monooxygenase [Alphaproteobacteria bacterium]